MVLNNVLAQEKTVFAIMLIPPKRLLEKGGYEHILWYFSTILMTLHVPW